MLTPHTSEEERYSFKCWAENKIIRKTIPTIAYLIVFKLSAPETRVILTDLKHSQHHKQYMNTVWPFTTTAGLQNNLEMLYNGRTLGVRSMLWWSQSKNYFGTEIISFPDLVSLSFKKPL